MSPWRWTPEFASWIASLAHILDARNAARLAPLLLGALFARGRSTVAAWLRAAGVGADFRLYYYLLSALGRKARLLSGMVLTKLMHGLPTPADRVLVALDDTPSKRAGPMVEGAGIHHNPTPGAAGAKFLYGHVWVTLAWVVEHPAWGALGLPLAAELYVRACDVKSIVPWYRWKFRTKLQLAAALLHWAAQRLKSLGRALWVAADGAYAKRPFLKEVKAAGATAVSRLRKDAALFDVPEPPAPGGRGRGRPRIYGEHRLSLAKRAGHKRGWTTEELVLYGEAQTKTYKTFLATWKPAGGAIRVVLVREQDGWTAFFCTDPAATVGQVLEAVADRSAIEQTFHDIKEVHGGGKQQVRNLWANIGAWHVWIWLHALIELWAWAKPAREIRDRRASPWDDPERRPSHADRRNALRRQCLREEYSRTFAERPPTRKIADLFRRLTAMVA